MIDNETKKLAQEAAATDPELAAKLKQLEQIEGVRSSQSEVDRERWQKTLDLAIDGLSEKDIAVAESKARESSDPDENDAATLIGFLRQYKAFGDKQAFIDRMARGYIYRLNDAAIAVRHYEGDISHALEQLANVASAVAELSFPAELKKQDADRAAQTKDQIEQLRKKIGSLNVS